MALRWLSSPSRSCLSDAVAREPPVSARPPLISTTGRFEVEKLLRTATGSQPCSKRRWQITCRVVHSPGASDLSRYGSMPWSCLLIFAHAASDLALSAFTVAVAIAGASLSKWSCRRVYRNARAPAGVAGKGTAPATPVRSAADAHRAERAHTRPTRLRATRISLES